MNIHSPQKGFTIMETLVAISLLLLAITGPMVFAQNGLRAAFQSRDQVTAFYLAQDAIEFVKNRRDHNILEREPDQWLSSFDGSSGSPDCESKAERDGGCTFDTSTSNGKIEACSHSNPAVGCLAADTSGRDDVPLKINNIGIIGFGDSSSSKNSIFARTVYVDPTGVEGEARVTVIVRWRSHENLGVREIEMVEYVRNWASALDL